MTNGAIQAQADQFNGTKFGKALRWIDAQVEQGKSVEEMTDGNSVEVGVSRATFSQALSYRRGKPNIPARAYLVTRGLVPMDQQVKSYIDNHKAYKRRHVIRKKVEKKVEKKAGTVGKPQHQTKEKRIVMTIRWLKTMGIVSLHWEEGGPVVVKYNEERRYDL